MATNLILSKRSSESEIKSYFNAILKLAKASKKYPVDLDEVWPLVYNRKQEAVRALTNANSEFVEGVDYQTERKNAQGGQFVATNYLLSLSCMEFFIARKVRPVFDVYRQVFHAITKQNFPIPQSYSEALLLAANQAKDIENLQQENHQLTSENQENRPKVDFANCIMQSETCISIGEMANILKQNKLATMGQNQLYQWLRMHTYLLKSGARRNLPSQKSITMGIMRIAEETYDKRTDVIINRKAVITPRGQSYFVDLFKKLSGNSYGLFK